MATYNGQSPSEIRVGDTVTDALGRTFTALSDAVMDLGDYHVKAAWQGEERSLTLDYDSKVTITYNESDWSHLDAGTSYSAV